MSVPRPNQDAAPSPSSRDFAPPLPLREQRVARREDLVSKHEEELARLAKELNERSESLKTREAEITRLSDETQRKAGEFSERETSVSQREADVAAQGEKLKALVARMKPREEAMATREAELDAKAAKVEKLEKLEAQLAAREEQLKTREAGVASREGQLNARSTELIAKSNELSRAMQSSAGAPIPSSAMQSSSGRIPSMTAPVRSRPSSASNLPPPKVAPLVTDSIFQDSSANEPGSTGELLDEPSIVELEVREDETREFMASPATSAFRPTFDPTAAGVANPSEISVLMADQLMLRNSSKGSSLPNDEDYLFQQIHQSSNASISRMHAP